MRQQHEPNDAKNYESNDGIIETNYSRSMKWVVESSPAAVTRRSGKNGDFAALRRLSPDGEELDGGGRVLGSFILRSAQQEEALHRIWYALRRWRLVSGGSSLPTTACSSINRR
ncbi:unnamed protein product [Spirodela intermedia]|uniref:Uncharacterized protein n=1 Tax=Spirodela intermedia TaxID=51605 RepID=A0ABN7ED74_SPIIN|nr:unnamed protein product [Spirodela intermedia]